MEIEFLFLRIPAILIAATFHELAHGYTAYFLGDPTPKHQGRLTLNPVKHLDPVGFLLLLVFGFGWARPIQINHRYFKDPKQDAIMVSLAGPLANLIIAILTAFITKNLLLYNISPFYISILEEIIFLNIILFIFNLLPFPPLDGSKIVFNLLPSRIYHSIAPFERATSIIFIFLAFSGYLGTLLERLYNPFLIFISRIIYS